jgi:hypothetical protein
MRTDTWGRALLLVGLAVAGVTLAWAGTTLGMGDVVTDENRVAEVSAVGTTVTVSSADGGSMLTETSDIEVADTQGMITITAQENLPFTQRE